MRPLCCVTPQRDEAGPRGGCGVAWGCCVVLGNRSNTNLEMIFLCSIVQVLRGMKEDAEEGIVLLCVVLLSVLCCQEISTPQTLRSYICVLMWELRGTQDPDKAVMVPCVALCWWVCCSEPRRMFLPDWLALPPSLCVVLLANCDVEERGRKKEKKNNSPPSLSFSPSSSFPFLLFLLFFFFVFSPHYLIL